jgi:hypothetical protein
MMNYRTGIMKESSLKCSIVDPRTGNPKIDHAVTIVGYKLDSTLDAECQGYFIIKNSWGTGWGESGYGKICIPKLESSLKAGTCNINYLIMIPSVGLIPGY